LQRNEAYIAYGFYHTKETLKPYPSGHLFYKMVFGNINLASGDLKKRVKSQHFTHQTKSKALTWSISRESLVATFVV